VSTVRILPRSAWTKTPRPADLVPLDADDVRGLALHWPGTTAPIGPASQTAIAARLEGYRRDHVHTNGWADIAYQAAVDQAGRIWHLRGLANRSAANGDTGPNRHWGAVVVLVGPGEDLTPACLAALRHLWRIWLDKYPDATRLVEHRDVRPEPTACPGPAVRAAIDSGAITRPATRPANPAAAPAPTLLEDIMSSAEERSAFAAQVATAAATTRYPLADWVADVLDVDRGTRMSTHELGQQCLARLVPLTAMVAELAQLVAAEGLTAEERAALAADIASRIDRVTLIVNSATPAAGDDPPDAP
jgi:hypothetical protein